MAAAAAPGVTLAAALWAACVAAEALALGLAVRGAGMLNRVACAQRKPTISLAVRLANPLVALLAFALLSDLAIAVGRELLLVGAPRPLAGLARGWYHVETLLVIAWPLGLAAACARAFTLRPRRWHLGLLGCAAVALWAPLVLEHPVPRRAIAGVLLLGELAGVVVAGVAIAGGWRLRWRAPQVALVALVAIELVVLLLGPFAHDVFRSWPVLARGLYTVGFGAAAAVLGAWPRERA